MTASVNSDQIQVGDPGVLGVFIRLAWTSTPVGTLTLEASNDGLLWTALDGISDATGGAAGAATWAISDMYFQYLRIVYTRTSSSGTLTGTYNIKRVRG